MEKAFSTFDSVEAVRDSAMDLFHRHFPDVTPVASACAPGRVNFIGEHTDYSDGFVLPGAIPLYTAVVVGESDTGDESVVVSSSFGEDRRSCLHYERAGLFGDYPLGVASLMGFEGRRLRLAIHSNLPAGSGLSSSASLLVACVAAMSNFRGGEADLMECALMARRVENEFVGVPCGFMDQFAVAMGVSGKALLLDCLDNRWVEVDASFPDAEWVVIYSGLHRELASGGYAHKVEAVQAAMNRILSVDSSRRGVLRVLPSHRVSSLCERSGVAPGSIPLLEHVSSENARVHLMRHALERGDSCLAGRILQEGHRSLSEDFGVSTPPLDLFVSEAERLEGVLGVRLTGAGMGGSLVALVLREGSEETCDSMAALAHSLMSPDSAVYRIQKPAQGVQTWML